MHRTHKTFSFCLSGLLLVTAWLLTTNLPAVAAQSARDGASFDEARLGSTPFNQATRLTGNPDSTGWHSNRFTEPAYLTGMSTQLLAQNGSAPAEGAAKKPAAPGGAIGSKHGSLAEIGAKLSNPASNVWALFTQFGITRSDGDLNTGESPIGGNLEFQPILPVPLFGEGADQWKLIMRPTVPFLMGNPVPTSFDNFDNKTGLGDTLFPLPLIPPESFTGHWLLGLGPTFTLPTSTIDAFGRQQWAVGPTGIFGYKTKKWVGGIFPQYHFGIGSRGDQGKKRDASFMELLYFFNYNLPEAWQVGFNPTISYDNKATSGNKWNVPIGLDVAKTVIIGNRPVKFQFGLEYSVVSQDAFGQRVQFKLNVIPVIEALIGKPLFGS